MFHFTLVRIQWAKSNFLVLKESFCPTGYLRKKHQNHQYQDYLSATKKNTDIC